MVSKKINVLVLCGGKSAEHEVSIQSAKNVIKAIKLSGKLTAQVIYIDRNGLLHPIDTKLLLGGNELEIVKNINSYTQAVTSKKNSNTFKMIEKTKEVDVIFPVLHGPFGEDGSVQGLLKIANIPFVGAGVLGSAVGMDKDVTKRLLRDAKVPVAKFVVIRSLQEANFEFLKKELKLPFFIKPANLGSSIGIHKIFSEKDFEKKVADSFSYDGKVIAEEYIRGREIECSVLGGEKPVCSVPGEIIVHDEFYSYRAKYLDENGAELKIPATLPKNTQAKVQKLALKAFDVLCSEHMARVDFFVTAKGKVYVNEINTIPGFTNISMYPKLFEASGISRINLIEKLVNLAISRHGKDKLLKTFYTEGELN